MRMGNGMEKAVMVPGKYRGRGTFRVTGTSREVTSFLRNGGLVGRVCMPGGVMGFITGW